MKKDGAATVMKFEGGPRHFLILLFSTGLDWFR